MCDSGVPDILSMPMDISTSAWRDDQERVEKIISEVKDEFPDLALGIDATFKILKPILRRHTPKELYVGGDDFDSTVGDAFWYLESTGVLAFDRFDIRKC